jgi:predicted phage terminase large subunit-like protein
MAKSLQVSRLDLRRSICEEDFYSFVQYFWDVIIPEKPVWNWHMKYICDELQEVCERIFRGEAALHKLLINVPPSTSKTTIGSIMLSAWCWTRMPSLRFIGGSYSGDLASDIGRKAKDIILSEKYLELWPELAVRKDQQAVSNFANQKKGTRFSVGTGGSVTGKHAHVIVIDDPLKPGNDSPNSAKIVEANTWMDEVIPSRKVDRAISAEIMIMQRLHENDPSGNWLRQMKDGKTPIRHICIPAELHIPSYITDSDWFYDDELSDPKWTEKLVANLTEEDSKGYINGIFGVNPPHLIRRYTDGIMDPVRLPKSVLEGVENTSRVAYAGQYLQSPIPRGALMFDTKKIKVIKNVNEPIVAVIRYWDKAASAGKGDMTAGVKMGKGRSGMIYILDVKRGQWGVTEREDIIVETAHEDGVEVEIGLEQEPGSGGKESAEATIKRLTGFLRFAKPSSGNKVDRAEPFAYETGIGNVSMVEAHWNENYIVELMYFPASRNDDQVDASSGGFAHIGRKKITIGAW